MIKRRLTDLYVVGKDLEIDDGKGAVVVHIRKMTPVDQENAIRRANAARARFLTGVRDPESDMAKDLLGQAMDMGTKEDLINFLNIGKLATIRAAKEAEQANEEEWSKDGYLQGIFDAWNDGLNQIHAINDPTDPDFEEAVRVFDEMKRFTTEVDELMEEDTISLQESLAGESLSQLQEEVAQELSDLNGNSAWLREYRRCEILLCTRDPENLKNKYFTSREEVDELPSEVYERLVQEFSLLTVEPIEGKDLPPKDSSLVLSELPEQEVIIPSFGPLDAVL